MKNQILLLTATCTVLLITGCTPKPIVGDNDAVKATYIHKYGVEIDDATDWKERGASGQVIQKLKNGATLTENWQDGVRHGPSTISFPHSETIYQALFYDNGTCIRETTHYRSGMPKREDLHAPNSFILVSTWYEDGLPQSQEKYQDSRLLSGAYFTPNQEIESEIEQGQGERPVRDGYGQLKGKELFADGLLTLKTELHSTGIPKSYTPYIQGSIHGIKRTFSPSGEPETIEEWNNDRLHGTVIVFQNSEKIAEIHYADGQKNGIEQRFKAGTPEIVEDISWCDGVRHGPSIVYVDNTKITDWYFEGKKVSRVEFVERQ